MNFTSPRQRAVPNRLADEREALVDQLDYHRATMLQKLEGLDDQSLRQPMTESGLSLLGLVKHLTANERGWLLENFARASAEEEPPSDDPDADFRVDPKDTVDVLVGRYLTVCDQTRTVVAEANLDDVVSTPGGAEVNLRAILLHLIQETARHNGHADIIRERIDGTTGQ